MEKHIGKIVYVIIVIITLFVFIFYFAACGNDITSRFDTVRVKNAEPAGDNGKTPAKIKAVKDAAGKNTANILDKDDNVIGSSGGKQTAASGGTLRGKLS